MVRSERPAEQELRCPTCNAGWLRDKVITERFEYEVDGKTQTVVAENVPVRECDNAACRERLSGPEAGRIRHEAICRAFRLLTPREIQSIRERLEHSQERLAQLTGIGVATISRWERGRLLQNRAMDNFLRVYFAVPEVRRLLQGAEQEPSLGTTVIADPRESPANRAMRRLSMEKHNAIVEAFQKVDSSVQTCHRPKNAKPSEGYTHIHGPSKPRTPPKCYGHPLIVERFNGLVGFRETLGERLNAVKRHDARIQQDPLGYSHKSIGGHKYVLSADVILARWGTFENFARDVIKECRDLDIW